MQNPWHTVPLEDYEGHMEAEGVQQLAPLRALFALALAQSQPESVAILGIAGGNGLGELDLAVTTRILGVDIQEEYLATVRQRYAALPGLELHCVDLCQQTLSCPPVQHVHAALIFEHAGTGKCLENALSLVDAGGWLSVVLQLPSQSQHGVSPTGFVSLQALKPHFQMIAPENFQALLQAKGLTKQAEHQLALPGGKGFWLGIFRRQPS